MTQAHRRTRQLKTIAALRVIEERQARLRVSDAVQAYDAARAAEQGAEERADQAHAGWRAAIGLGALDLDVCRQWAAVWRTENDHRIEAARQTSKAAETLAEDRWNWLGAVQREEVAAEARQRAERRLKLKTEEAALAELADRTAQRGIAR